LKKGCSVSTCCMRTVATATMRTIRLSMMNGRKFARDSRAGWAIPWSLHFGHHPQRKIHHLLMMIFASMIGTLSFSGTVHSRNDILIRTISRIERLYRSIWRNDFTPDGRRARILGGLVSVAFEETGPCRGSNKHRVARFDAAITTGKEIK